MEQRSSQRFGCDISTSAMINSKVIWCRMTNISQQGAFLEAANTHKELIHRRLLGKKVTFSMRAFPSIWSTVTGEIVRVEAGVEKKGFGVRFIDWSSIPA